MHGHPARLVSASVDAVRCRARRRRWPRQAVVAVREVLAPVAAAGLLARCAAAATSAVATVAGSSPPRPPAARLDRRCGPPALGSALAAALQARRRLRSTPAPPVMVRWTWLAPGRPAGDARRGPRGRRSGDRGRACAGRSAGPDVGGDPLGEDQAFEQGVGGQPVRAVHAGAGDLAAGVQAGDAGAAVAGRCGRRRWRSGRPGRPGSAR